MQDGYAMKWLTGILGFVSLTWREVLLGLLLFVATSVIGLFLAKILLLRLPASYFCDSSRHEFWIASHPVVRRIGLIVKNILGGLIVILGVILSMPGLPGPGVLMILFGIMLLDFPGQRRLMRWLISRPRVFDAINRLRQQHGKPPLVLECPTEAPIRLSNQENHEACPSRAAVGSCRQDVGMQDRNVTFNPTDCGESVRHSWARRCWGWILSIPLDTLLTWLMILSMGWVVSASLRHGDYPLVVMAVRLGSVGFISATFIRISGDGWLSRWESCSAF